MASSTIFTTIAGIPVPVSTIAVDPTTTSAADPTTTTDPDQQTTTTTDPGNPDTTTTTQPPPTTTSTPTDTDTTTTASPTDTDTNTNTDTATTTTTDNTATDTTTTSPTDTPTTTTSTPTPTATPTQSTVFDTTTGSDGQVVTRTSVVVTTPTITGGADQASHSAPKSFFDNKGAVAGVFTVVGLAVVVIVVAVVTNAIRRRRAQKLDREIAEAAAEAAHAPGFTDDDYFSEDRLGKGGSGPGSAGGGGGDLRSLTTGYSDTTHGTFAQHPMAPGESYNMAELAPYDYAAAGATGGAAGIGAMGGLNRARSQTAPYNAFARPPANTMPNPYDAGAYGQQNMRYAPHAGNDLDLLDAAGLAGGAGAGYAAAQQGYGGQQQQQQNLARNPSLGPSAATSPSEHSAYSSPYPAPQQAGGYEYNPYNPGAAGYNPYQQQQAPYPPQPYTAAGPAPVPTPSPPRPTSIVDPYGGYVDEPEPAPAGHPSPPLPQAGSQQETRSTSPGPGRLLSGNFASPPASSEGHEHEEHRASIQDDDDYGYEPGRRVLKVANE